MYMGESNTIPTELCYSMSEKLLETGKWGRVGAQSVEYLPLMHQDLAFIPAPHKPGVAEYTWNLVVWEVEAGGPGFQGQSSVT